MIHGNLGEDDIAGGGSAANGILDANRDGTLDPTRSGETLRDGNDLIAGDSGLGTAGDGDVIAGDNARIQRPLAAGDWRVDPQRKDLDAEPGAQLRDVFLFDIELVGTGEPGDAATGESGVDTISGNGGEDILIGQGNGAVAGRLRHRVRHRRAGELPERRPAAPARARSAAPRRRRTATTTTTTCPT